MKFVNRESELKALRKIIESNKFELLIIYGRRRIGKTRLVFEALKNKEFVYYLAVEKNNVKRFKREVSRIFPEIKFVEEDWEAIFHFLKDKIVVIDEFQTIIKEDPTNLSIFQKIVDNFINKGSATKIILVGSLISLMKNKVLSYKSLYMVEGLDK